MNSLLQAPIARHLFSNWPCDHGREAVLQSASLRKRSSRNSCRARSSFLDIVFNYTYVAHRCARPDLTYTWHFRDVESMNNLG